MGSLESQAERSTFVDGNSKELLVGMLSSIAFPGPRRHAMPKESFSVVGHSFPRKDAVARVTGRERYTCGRQLQGVARRNSLYVRNPVNEVV